MSRPRKHLAERKPSGKIKYRKEDERSLVKEQRKRRWGLTSRQLNSPLGGYLAGVLYMRGQITIHQLAAFNFFCRVEPRSPAVSIKEKVQGGRHNTRLPFGQKYADMAKRLGQRRMDILHALSRDELVCSLKELRAILDLVPVSRSEVLYITSARLTRT